MLIGAALAGLIAAVIHGHHLYVNHSVSAGVMALTGGLVGVLISFVAVRRTHCGLNLAGIWEHARRLAQGESALILVAPVAAMRPAMGLIHDSAESPPASFLLHPARRHPQLTLSAPGNQADLLNVEQLQDQARALASRHRLGPRPAKDRQVLQQLASVRRDVQGVCQDLAEAAEFHLSLPPAAEWLLDNEYILESNARDVRLQLPHAFFRQLPALGQEGDAGKPRIYDLTAALAQHTESRLDEEIIQTYIAAYQSVQPLTIAEIWALPQMLRIVLIDRIGELAGRALTDLRDQEAADCWANRLSTINRRDPHRFFGIMADLNSSLPQPSPYFILKLLDYLHDEGLVLVAVQDWLERTFHKSPSELILQVRNRQTRDQVTIGNAFTSLRNLALVNWNDCFEDLSRVEQIFCRDPSGIYPRMDFNTRNRYRRVVEELSHGSKLDELAIAEQAVALAERAAKMHDAAPEQAHIGTYLVGDARPELAALVSARERFEYRLLHWLYRHHTSVYFTGVSLAFDGVLSLFVWGALPAPSTGLACLLAVLFALPAGQIAVDVVNTLVIRFFPPRTLPKMDYLDTGIPDDCRTLVVVPMMLSDAATIHHEAEKLEIRYLANPESNLLFGLYSDFLDADQAHCETDAALLEQVIQSMKVLNDRYGSERFFLFHRDRQWSEGEQKYIGWERKRGKLEELNDLLAGKRPTDAERLVYVGEPQTLSDVRFVITLDSDTQLPPNTARRLIETASHPLNQVRQDAAGRILAGYTIIQPTVRPGLPSSNNTPFSRLFANVVGIDPYPTAASDTYQDLTGEGSYHGKGIYDVRAFTRILSNRFPEARLLSHDLIEGAYVRVGLASDIELYDEFPPDYLSYVKRQHRWIRGDWQIAEWILPWVPQAAGGYGPNPLSWINRWKIFDNLRRSLLPVANLALLIGGWLLGVRAGWIATVLVAVQMCFHCLIEPVALAASRRSWSDLSFAQITHDLLRVVVEIAMLPFQAGLALDAIVRVAYRRWISHRGLLEWITMQDTQRNRRSNLAFFLRGIVLAGLLAVAVTVAVSLLQPASLAAAGPWLILWMTSPLCVWLLSRRPIKQPPPEQLSKEDRRFLRVIARRTWRYFADFVNAESHWLPPDNYQVAYQKGLAQRTSPTNVGMYLTSVLGAWHMGYLNLDDAVDRLRNTLETLHRLERYEGHLLNWYETSNLRPLLPKYVSMVDSGNLLGSLWTLKRGLDAAALAPLLQASHLAGISDTARILEDDFAGEPAAPADPHTLTSLLGVLDQHTDTLGSLVRTVWQCHPLVARLESQTNAAILENSSTPYWIRQVRLQLASCLSVCERYLSWRQILTEKSAAEIATWDQADQETCQEALEHVPSLQELALNLGPAPRLLHALLSKTGSADHPPDEWLARFGAALENAKRLACERLGALEHVGQLVTDLAESMNMKFLYNQERRLFATGYNVTEQRQDSSFYDLLESEARLGSLVAIAHNDVPVEHWFAMNRAYGSVGRHRTLLSWNGTMFEYLMPQLFLKSFEHTLLNQAEADSVDVQIEFGRRHKIPWGISEAAFADLDPEKTYQYQAFGVPELGLKRGLADRIVIAPYACLLAVGVRPGACVSNLKQLVEFGLLSHYGFYESLDFHRQPAAEASAATIVRTYMAHHVGMSFLALTNFLQHECLQQFFHADPRIRTVEPLLHERIPLHPPLHHIATRKRAASITITSELAPVVSQLETPHTEVPRVQLLSNGRYHTMVTAAGGGYSRWNQFDLTRWQPDSTMDPWGLFCYIRDVESGQLWSNSYQPTGGEVAPFRVNFTLGGAVFRRIDQGIECKSEIIVAPEDDVEIRRMTLFNRSDRQRRLELTSFIELAMAPHAASFQHPAFNKLFIQTEALPAEGALLAWRRQRTESDPPIFAAHRFTLQTDTDESAEQALAFETDRRRFIGRGCTLANPMGAWQKPGNSQGYVLDPIFSLRREIVLERGQRLRLSAVLGAADSREKAIQLMVKYGDPRAIGRAAEFAWSAAQLELRLLHIQPDEARRFQQMASYLLYPSRRLRPTGQRIAENRKGQAALWQYSISGDLPIALAIIGKSGDQNLVRQVLQAHSYWRMHGLAADLVIINEEANGYNEPLREELERLIHFHGASTGVNKPGGIFLLSAGKLSSEDKTLLRAVARLVLIGTRGSLAQQLATPTHERPLSIGTPAQRNESQNATKPLPFLELQYFNSLGGFKQDGREYAIYLGPGINTPSPWVNVIANPQFGTLISETGAGFTWQGNSQRNRLTAWSNDPVTDPAAEAIYIRDEETRRVWTPTAAPIRERSAYRARHGAGYTVYEHNSPGLEQELTVFVPMDDSGGSPIKVQLLSLRNTSGQPRKLTLTYYVSWTLGESREASQMHVVSTWDDEAQVMLAHNYYHPDYPDRVAFAALGQAADSYTADRTAFVGRNRTLSNAQAMEHARLNGSTGAGLDPCAALRMPITLAPGEKIEIPFLMGQAASTQQVHDLVTRYRKTGAAQRALKQTQAWWDRRLGAIQIKTPDQATNILVNRWLLYQTLSCRVWGRSALYQSGGAFGFRDQLQDALGLLYAAPALAREHILLAASRQFKEGDVQHWWHPPKGGGIRSRISDDLLWLPFVTAQYLRVTGDTGILQETVSFLEAPRLIAEQDESYQTPGVSPERGSLFDHCQQALSRAQQFGEHGLPLMGTGDWNDGMNRVGAKGQGESVWLAWFLVDVLKGMSELAVAMSRPELQQSYIEERQNLTERIEKFAWDGEWYRRATFDDGSPLGSHENQEAKIDSLPQSWASLAGAARPDRTGTALDAAWNHLVREHERLVLLFDPPFENSHPSPGYIQGYPPGVRENGGQYTHAAIWLAMGLARQGQGARAAELLQLINPIEIAREPDQVWRYGLEPYVMAADVYSLPGRVGQGGWSWYTGSAAWMYRAWVEEILGLQIRGQHLRIAPVIPNWWDGFEITYRRGEATYRIQVENPHHCERGVAYVELDGQRLPEGGDIPLAEDSKTHCVVVRMASGVTAAAAKKRPVTA